MTETPKTAKTILVIDDEKSMRECLEIIFSSDGHNVLTASNGTEGLQMLKNNRVDLVIQDLKMPGLNGTNLLKALKAVDESTPVIIITAFSTWDTAVQAMRLGAYGYIKKPFDNDNIRSCVERALKSTVPAHKGEEVVKEIIGNNARMREIFEMVRRIAPADATVFIEGESGTGKELIAKAIHAASNRANEPFVTINCGAFPESLLESELFGHVAGAFTGSVGAKKGLLEVADKGTFFLDEVGEMSPRMQVKFLRALENQEFKPVGSTETKKVNVRFITATNCNIAEMVEESRFREDLYYRLNVIPLRIPPLRERMDDVPLLAGNFLAKYANRMNKSVSAISPEAAKILSEYKWPGNVREVENTIQRAVALTDGDIIGPEHLVVLGAHKATAEEKVAATLVGAEGIDLDREMTRLEKRYIAEALRLTHGNMSNAAKMLNISFRSIRYKVKKLGLKPRRGSLEGVEV
ncbi:MAG: sigma-54 dependent transcriptional regulator [Planctomycetota bacterium]